MGANNETARRRREREEGGPHERRANLQGGSVMPDHRVAVSTLDAGVSSSLRRLIATAAGLIAAAMLMTMTAQRAHALSPADPGAAPLAAKFVSDGLIQVRGGGG